MEEEEEETEINEVKYSSTIVALGHFGHLHNTDCLNGMGVLFDEGILNHIIKKDFH